MIKYGEYAKIKYCTEELNLNISQIAKKLKLDIRTIKKWQEKEKYEQKKIQKKISKLDQFKEEIQEMLEKNPYSGVQIFQKIKEKGYQGGKTILRKYIKKIRPKKQEAYLTLKFKEGECAQVDWGQYGTVNVGGDRRRLYFFVMVLCYSRMMYIEFTLSTKMEFFLGCHINAFEYFKGIPNKIMIDNLKTGVIEHKYGEIPIFNKRYLDFANHYGFKIHACNVRKGNEKGIVENGVKYIKQNFLNGFKISDFKILKPSVNKWKKEIANVRIHGKTKEKPINLYEKEKKFLTKINNKLYDIARIKEVKSTSQFRVNFESNKYSVPYNYASQLLTIKIYPEKLYIYKEDKLIADHTRSFEKNKDFENPDHVMGLIKIKKKAKDEKILLKFLSLSPKSELFLRGLQEKRINEKIHIKKIVALCEIYKENKVRRAIEDALETEFYSSEFIINILEQRKNLLNFYKNPIHLIRKEDILDIELTKPDLNIYKNKENNKNEK